MAYTRSFRYLRTHVLCDEPPSGELEHDREQVYSALRDGPLLHRVDSLAPARGFRFEADDLPMGAEAPASPRTFRVHVPAPADLRLLRDGSPVASAANATELRHEAGDPGVYRSRGAPAGPRPLAHVDRLQPDLPALTKLVHGLTLCAERPISMG